MYFSMHFTKKQLNNEALSLLVPQTAFYEIEILAKTIQVFDFPITYSISKSIKNELAC